MESSPFLEVGYGCALLTDRSLNHTFLRRTIPEDQVQIEADLRRAVPSLMFIHTLAFPHIKSNSIPLVCYSNLDHLMVEERQTCQVYQELSQNDQRIDKSIGVSQSRLRVQKPHLKIFNCP
mmetsp:Transcript_62261/g.184172  ORF Transcript_62261/g.184172 Transcript_62261/m.184172 type:complete len:121 (-) Transcript_62261:2665-3027(-)